MLYGLSTFLATLFALGHARYTPVTEQALQDEITSLPGQPANVDFLQYGGYIDLPNSEKSIFYWLQMAESNEHAPVVLWTNGGPGCSGLAGALVEQGAFRVQSDGTLIMNPGRWNQIANMLYIEQPAGVGFSYSTNPDDYVTGDSQAVADMFNFIIGFFQVFPNLRANPFYISSESYGGHYIPLLTQYILMNNPPPHEITYINFMGAIVGNPYTDPVENAKGMYDTFYGHSLVPLPLFKEYQAACDDGKNYMMPNCSALMTALEIAVDDVYLYGLDWPVCHGGNNALKASQQRHFVETVLDHLGRGRGISKNLDREQSVSFDEIFMSWDSFKSEDDEDESSLGDIYDACAVAFETSYLNRADVQTAIHANVGTNWTLCSGMLQWNMSDFDRYMENTWEMILDNESEELKLMIYSGNDDSVCGTLGTQSWLWPLFGGSQTPWQAWYIDEPQNGQQVAGYWLKFKRAKTNKELAFVTVNSAGHQVPWFKSQKSYEMFHRFLEGNF